MDIDGIRTFTPITPLQSPVQKVSEYNADNANVNIDEHSSASGSVPETDATINKANAVHRSEKGDEKKSQLTQEAEASDKMLKTAVAVANKKLKESQRMLQCSVHERTKRIMVKVVDTETDEVVREIPPEKTLDLFAKVLEMAGILFDEKK